MNILVCCIADSKYLVGAQSVLGDFRKNIINPEGHNIEYQIFEPTTEFAYLHFMNFHHAGTLCSLTRFGLFRLEQYDRIIYLDSDLEIVDNVDLLISDSLNDKMFYAVHDYGCPNYYRGRLDFPESEVFNGGVLIINKPLLSKKFFKHLVDSLKSGESFDGSDQGYLGKFFHTHKEYTVGILPDEYNYAFQDAYYPRITSPRIVHFTGRKPWDGAIYSRGM